MQKCQLDWASPRLPLLPRRLETRSLPLQVCVFEICQFVQKRCDKLSPIRLDSWVMLDWLPTHVRTALIYTTETFALERSSTEQSEEFA